LKPSNGVILPKATKEIEDELLANKDIAFSTPPFPYISEASRVQYPSLAQACTSGTVT
jgi:hypothetical protein